jgi:hypothetical protein
MKLIVDTGIWYYFVYTFSNVKVQIEAEDVSMMQQLKAEDFVCFSIFLLP